MAQLDFLEVGIYPQLVQRNDGHQRSACGHTLPQLHRASSHIAVHRRRQSSALGSQPGFAKFSGGDHHARVRFNPGAIGQGLVAEQLLFGHCHAGLCRSQCGFTVGQLGLGVAEFFFGDSAVAHQGLAAVQIVGGTGDLGLGLDHLGLTQINLRLKAAIVGVQGAHLAHGLREAGLRGIETDFGVSRVQFDQGLARFHEVIFIRQNGHDGAACLRRDLDDVALHIGVVGGLVVAGHQPFVGSPAQTDHNDQASNGDQGFFTRGVASSAGRCW